jgi:hypothetical protein
MWKNYWIDWQQALLHQDFLKPPLRWFFGSVSAIFKKVSIYGIFKIRNKRKP